MADDEVPFLPRDQRPTAVARIKAMYAQLLVRIYIAVYRAMCGMRQRLVRWMTPSTARVAVVIGDVLAEGVGDSFTYAGLAHRLQGLFDGTRRESKLTLGWRVYSLGRLGAAPADWLPGGKRLEPLVAGPYARADIVAYVIGELNDEAPADVARTAEAVARLGKHIVVCAFGALAAPGTPEFIRGLSRRTRTAEELALVKRRLAECQGAGTVTWDVNLEKVLIGDALCKEPTFTTFNSYGFRRLARELADKMALAAKKVEWNYWKQLI